MRIASYSFFDSPDSPYAKEKGRAMYQYAQFLGLLIRTHATIWSGWHMRLSHDDAVTTLPYWKAMVEFEREGFLELVDHGPAVTLCGIGGMLERLRPAFETDCEAVICRDIDIIHAPFDRRAVEEWLATGRGVHVIHYASAHSGYMGGALGVKPARFRDLVQCRTLEQFVERGTRSGLTMKKHGDDQHLLNRHYLQLCPDTLIHELHHAVGDTPAADIRHEISSPMPEDIPKRIQEEGDSCSPGIGLCAEPKPALDWYDSLDLPVIRRIQDIERRTL